MKFNLKISSRQVKRRSRKPALEAVAAKLNLGFVAWPIIDEYLRFLLIAYKTNLSYGELREAPV